MIVPAVLALALLVVVGGAVALLSYAATQASQPLAVARQYCTALRAQDYAAAYMLTSSAARNQMSQAQFAADAKLQDTVDGRVTQCTPAAATRDVWRDAGGNLSFVFGGTHSVAVMVTLARAHLVARAGTLDMAQEGSAWKVGSIANALQGTPLGPLLLADAFCKSLAAGDFKTAYSALSAHQVSLEQTETNFAKEATLPSGSHYAGCSPNYATYRVVGASATVSLTLNISVATASGTSVIPVAEQASFVQEQGAWKLDGLDLPASAT
jgi:hypothetical protein